MQARQNFFLPALSEMADPLSGSKYMIFRTVKFHSGLIEGVRAAVLPSVHGPRLTTPCTALHAEAPSGRVSARARTGEGCFGRDLRTRRGARGLIVPKIHAISSAGNPYIAGFS
jgi:hypothetical protein